MNILFVSMLFGGGYGAGYAAHKECQELSKRGHLLHVVHSERDINHYQNISSKYYYVPYHKIPLANILFLKRDLEKTITLILKSNKIDLIYVQSLELGLIDQKILKGYPLVYFMRSATKGVEREKPKEYWTDSIRRFFITKLLIRLEKRIINWADKIIVESSMMKKEISGNYSVNSKRIVLVSGGLDRKDFPRVSSRQRVLLKHWMNAKKDEKIIIFAGRLVPVKGITYLIDALPRILKKYNARLLILGSGFLSKYHKCISDRITKLNLEKKIINLGKVPQDQIYKYISAADLIVVPSTYEPFGMVALQAARYNRPLIITENVGSVDLLRDYDRMRIVKTNSSREISNASLELLNCKDYSGVKEIRDWKDIADDLEKVFIQVAI